MTIDREFSDITAHYTSFFTSTFVMNKRIIIIIIIYFCVHGKFVMLPKIKAQRSGTKRFVSNMHKLQIS